MNGAEMADSHPPESSPASGVDFADSWRIELDRLEIDVELAEALLAANSGPNAGDELVLPGPWEPQAMRYPLPADLAPRARLVLERQLAVIHAISTRLTQTGQQQRLAHAVRSTGQVDLPIYVDVTA